MKTPSSLKLELIEQYNNALATVQKIEGAIAACNELEAAAETDETPTEETPDAWIWSNTNGASSTLIKTKSRSSKRSYNEINKWKL